MIIVRWIRHSSCLRYIKETSYFVFLVFFIYNFFVFNGIICVRTYKVLKQCLNNISENWYDPVFFVILFDVNTKFLQSNALLVFLDKWKH